MAAIICKAISDLLGALGKAVCIPCNLLGMGCSTLGDVVSAPFFPYLATTFGLNLPGLIYAIRSHGMWGCHSLTNWLLWNGLFALAHLAASIYIVRRIRQDAATEEASTPQPEGDTEKAETAKVVEEGGYINGNFWTPKEGEDVDEGAGNSVKRIKHVVCYDKGTAIYIVVFIAWIAWLCIGMSRRLEVVGQCPQQEHFANVTIMCGYTYLMIVFLVFGCSLCCLK